MNLTLSLSSNELDNEDLQELTRQLCDSIADETEIKAEIPNGAVVQGTRGDPITIGVITLALLSSPAVVALCEVLKAYFNRNSSLTIKMTKADGSIREITVQNLNLEQVENFFGKLDHKDNADE